MPREKNNNDPLGLKHTHTHTHSKLNTNTKKTKLMGAICFSYQY